MNYYALDEALAYINEDENALTETLYNHIKAISESELILESFDINTVKNNLKKFIDFIIQKIKDLIHFIKTKLKALATYALKFVKNLKLPERYKKYKERKVSEAVDVYDLDESPDEYLNSHSVILNPDAFGDILSKIKDYQSKVDNKTETPGQLKLSIPKSLIAPSDEDADKLYSDTSNLKIKLDIENYSKVYDILVTYRNSELATNNFIVDSIGKCSKYNSDLLDISDKLEKEIKELKKKADESDGTKDGSIDKAEYLEIASKIQSDYNVIAQITSIYKFRIESIVKIAMNISKAISIKDTKSEYKFKNDDLMDANFLKLKKF